MRKIVAVAASIAGLLLVGSVSASSAPLANADTLRQAGLAPTNIEQVHWRGYRHCHWRYGYRRCHGGHYYRPYPYWGWGPGIHFRFGGGHRHHFHHRHHRRWH
jgi:hypothetical protein